jgi:hypothetical protein
MASEVTELKSRSPPSGKDAPSSEHEDIEFLEEGEGGSPSISDMNASRLSQAHREYLLNRHGSLDLDPLPSADDDDPYNWPAWKVRMSIHVYLYR